MEFSIKGNVGMKKVKTPNKDRGFINSFFNKKEKLAETINEDSSPRRFTHLSAINNAKNIEIYSQSLNEALNPPQNSEIHNIAITGPYSSGKSTFLKSYAKRDEKWLDISLASFSNTKTTQENIEESIFQQILYRVKNKSIPRSRFNKITDEPLKLGDMWKNLFAYTIWFSAIFYLLFPRALVFTDLLKLFFGNELALPNAFLSFLSITVSVTGIFFFLKEIKNTFWLKKISSLNALTGEVSFLSSSDSVLKKHVDELIYFFSQTEFDVVVIEDLDRFEGNEIFIKLRELNRLINNSEYVEKQYGVRFIYTVKDNLFSGEERTKFFEHIIPIIPIINSSNSYKSLKDELDRANIKSGVQDKFLKAITYYIDDMRILKNIVNEFVIYKTQLGHGAILKPEKILSLIIYKNKYPQDFAKLHKNKGDIFDVFNNKKERVSSKISAICKQIKDKKSEIERIKSELHLSVKDINKLILFDFCRKVQNKQFHGFEINGDVVLLEQASDEDYFKQLVEMDILKLTNQRQHIDNANLLINQVSNFNKLQERKELILDSENIHNINSDIENLEDKVSELRALSLYELCLNFPNDNSFIEEFQSESLVSYLLKNGFIDETYQDYISLFYDDGLKINDRKFIKSIRYSEPLGFDYKLENPAQILNDIDIRDLRSSSSLNIDIFEHILSNELALEFNSLLSPFSPNNSIYFEFMNLTLNKSKAKSNLINMTLALEGNFLPAVINENRNNESDISNWLFSIFAYAKQDLLLKLPEKTQYLLSKATSSLFDLLVVKNNQFIDNTIESIKTLEIKFEKINLLTDSDNILLVDRIIAAKAFSLNSHMLMIALKRPYFTADSHDIELSYNAVRTELSKDILAYIDKNIGEFVTNIIFNNESYDVANENEASIKTLINHPNLENETKIKFINKQNFKLSELISIKNIDLWPSLFKINRVVINWTNLFHFMNNCENNLDVITEILNKSQVIEDLKKIPVPTIEKSIVEQFSKFILTNAELSLRSFKAIINKFNKYIDQNELGALQHEVLEVLIEQKLISMKDKQFELIEYNHPELLALFIQMDFKKFIIVKKTTNDISLEDKIKLLESRKFHKNYKLRICNEITSSELHSSSVLAETVFDFQLTLDDIDPNLEFIEILATVQRDDYKKLEYLLAVIDYLEPREILSFMENMHDRYKKIGGFNTNYVGIKDDCLNQQLALKLENKKIITRSTPYLGSLRMYLNRKLDL